MTSPRRATSTSTSSSPLADKLHSPPPPQHHTNLLLPGAPHSPPPPRRATIRLQTLASACCRCKPTANPPRSSPARGTYTSSLARHFPHSSPCGTFPAPPGRAAHPTPSPRRATLPPLIATTPSRLPPTDAASDNARASSSASAHAFICEKSWIKIVRKCEKKSARKIILVLR